MTKHQVSAEVFIAVSFKKEKRTAWPDLFLKRTTIKTSADIWYFSHWFLVTNQSNEKDKNDMSVQL